MGYRAMIWPEFEWLDPNTYNGYSHWGYYLPGGAPWLSFGRPSLIASVAGMGQWRCAALCDTRLPACQR